MSMNSKTPAMVLHELCVKRSFPPPQYKLTYSRTGTHDNRFDYEVEVAGTFAGGTGTSKQISKHNAAYNALQQLEEDGLYNSAENPVGLFDAAIRQKTDTAESLTKPLNFISSLIDLCAENKLPAPVFREFPPVGPPHCCEFTVECHVGSIKTISTANTKKRSKHFAAMEMAEKIKEILPNLIMDFDHNAIVDNCQKAMDLYRENFMEVMPNKTLLIDDYTETFRKRMQDKGILFEDLKIYLDDITNPEASVRRLLEILGMNLNVNILTRNPSFMLLNVELETPFTLMEMGPTEEEATRKLFTLALFNLNVLLSTNFEVS